MRRLATLLLLMALAAAPASAALTTVRVASGLSGPVFVTAPPGDTARLFIVEFNTGRIKILSGGAVLPTPFLDIGSLVTDNTNFGLLGLAFHPSYASNGFFYVQYVDNSFRPTLARYQVSGVPNLANPASGQIVMQLSAIDNHQGGTIAFGPDGYLYIGWGDGNETSVGDPANKAQNDGDLHGKMVRIDVDSASPYAVPPSNPFVGAGDPLDEIWAKGLRNPFRFSFDRLTGDLYIGDVGQALREEIDFQPAGSPGGQNYGWRLKEGTLCYNPPTGCDPGGLTDPIHEYSHAGFGCSGSVSGGSVYRGSAIAGLQGTYFFADFCSARLWSFRYTGGSVTELTERTAELAPGGGLTINSPTAIAEDAAGELYIVDIGGEIFKIVSTGTPTTTTSSTSTTSATAVPTTSTSTSTTATSPASTSSSTTVASTSTTTTLAPACGPAPATGCRGALPSGASIVLKDQGDDTRDEFRWRITKGAATMAGEFRDPVNGSAVYHVCVYDSSARPQPLMEVAVPAGGTCGRKPCWKATKNGFRYANRAATQGGVTGLGLVAGIEGKARVNARGKGTLVPMPMLGLNLPVTAQLVISDGAGTACWQTTFGSALDNDPTRFHSRGP